jgi:transcription antitermination protein NusB
MATRRRARESALQMLFQFDASEVTPKEVVRLYRECFGEGALPDEFSIGLFLGIANAIEAVDAAISQSSDHWRLDRMNRVDRNILRIGVYEIMHAEGTPPRVAINEAVELAKRFGTAESAAFVNGVLDRVARDRSKL